MVGEVWEFDQRRILPYLAPEELHLAHNFVFARTPCSARRIKEIVEEFTTLTDETTWPAWFLNNHDDPRIVSRWSTPGDDGNTRQARGRLAAMLLLTLRGTPFLYRAKNWAYPTRNYPAGSARTATTASPQRTPDAVGPTVRRQARAPASAPAPLDACRCGGGTPHRRVGTRGQDLDAHPVPRATEPATNPTVAEVRESVFRRSVGRRTGLPAHGGRRTHAGGPELRHQDERRRHRTAVRRQPARPATAGRNQRECGSDVHECCGVPRSGMVLDHSAESSSRQIRKVLKLPSVEAPPEPAVYVSSEARNSRVTRFKLSLAANCSDYNYSPANCRMCHRGPAPRTPIRIQQHFPA